MNQREFILAMLTDPAQTPVCGNDLLELHIARYAARIHELRKLGYPIVSHPCKRHQHTATVYEYQLPVHEYDMQGICVRCEEYWQHHGDKWCLGKRPI